MNELLERLRLMKLKGISYYKMSKEAKLTPRQRDILYAMVRQGLPKRSQEVVKKLSKVYPELKEVK